MNWTPLCPIDNANVSPMSPTATSAWLNVMDFTLPPATRKRHRRRV